MIFPQTVCRDIFPLSRNQNNSTFECSVVFSVLSFPLGGRFRSLLEGNCEHLKRGGGKVRGEEEIECLIDRADPQKYLF